MRDYSKSMDECLCPSESRIVIGKRSSPSKSPLRHLLGPVTDNHELGHLCVDCSKESSSIVNAENFKDTPINYYLF